MKVLIDDDKFIRLSWNLVAKSKGEKLLTFESVQEFLDACGSILKDTPIYVDSNLSNGEKGELLSKTIFELGFKKIYLATGYSDLDISKYDWISGITTKTYPNAE